MRTSRGLSIVLVTIALVLASSMAAVPSQQVDTLRFVWFTDGPDLPAIQALVDVFNAKNPDIKVDLSIVPFAQLNTLLTTQAAAGQAPDVARVTEPYRFDSYALDLRPYLQDKSFPKAFLAAAQVLTTLPNGAVFGFPSDFTMNGPFINLSLVQKAGLSLPKGDRVSWSDWMDLAVKTAKATGVPYAAAVDRSGHRLDGFIQTMGGGYFTPNGKDVRINSPATEKAINYFVQLNKNGTMPLEVWAGGGAGYADARQLFVNQQLVFYVSGNWQMAFFRQAIGNKFDWKVVLNGCEVQCGGMPGGKFLIAFKDTKAPAKVARLMEYLGSRASIESMDQTAYFLPTRNDLLKEGVKYPGNNDDMNTFIKGIGLMPKAAFVDNYNSHFGPIADEVRDRVTQAIIGELTVEQALDRAQATAKDLLK
ncbi:MAG TPA: extracellular solute-binding protein [bacterium]|nr:extracellular solute-binding protein [bacterium]